MLTSLPPPRPWLPWLAGVLLVLPAPGRAADPAPPRPAVSPAPAASLTQREQVIAEARRRFRADDWAGLDEMARTLRDPRVRLADGRWMLPSFYEGLDPKGQARKPEEWTAWFAKLDAWRAAAPGSPTLPVARANALTSYAWDARGGGWGSTVGADRWPLFEKRLAEARAVLDAAADAPDRCLHWAAVMQNIALGQSWDREEYDALFAEAVRREPTYHSYYFRKALNLLPRWGGRPGEWEQFAADAEAFDPEEGPAIYTRIAWSLEEYHDDLFKETAITWERMRAGFRALLKQFPDSDLNRNAYARFAVQAGDRETAHKLFASLAGRIDLAGWGGAGPLAVARALTDPATPENQRNPAARLVRPGDPAVHSLAYAPDGQTLAAGYEDGRVVVRAVPAGNIVWEGTVSGRGDAVAGVAFSPDGQLLAACAAEDRNTSHPGVARVWETAGERREISRITAFEGGVERVAWNPDGQTLALVGGTFNKHGEGFFWDRKTRQTTPMDWPRIHSHQIHALAISPDGKTLATECNRSLTVWDLPKNFTLFDTQQTLPGWTNAVAFSPDGKTFAAAGSPNWDRRVQQSGTVVLFDAVTWKERAAPRVDADAGGLHCVAYSPDGRFLAAGGLDHGVHVWDAATLKPRALYVNHTKLVRAVAFSPDGKTLASAGDDGAILLWETPAGE